MFTILKKYWIISLIFLIAVFFRTYKLSTVPPSPSLDEVSIGYNAFSILKTGRDEYGTRFPILLRAYDDYRPGLYVYTVIPFVAIFGLRVIDVRLPSVIFSLITILLTYGIGNLLFDGKSPRLKNISVPIGTLSSFLLAISPWHIYISRLGHEVNLGFMLVVLGVYLFLRGEKYKNSWTLFFSFITFALSLYGYQSEKAVTPIILLTLCVLYRKFLLKNWKMVVFSFIAMVVVLLPLVKVSTSPDALIRFTSTSEFNSDNPHYQQMLQRYEDAKQRGDLFNELLYNKRVDKVVLFLDNYISHFKPEWLFANPYGDQHKAPGVGLLYPWELPFILIGIIGLALWTPQTVFGLLYLWFLSSPIPASVTSGAPHAMRSFTFLPVWQFFTAFGIIVVASFIRPGFIRRAFFAILGLVIFGYALNFGNQYFVWFPRLDSEDFQYSLSQALPSIIKNDGKYNKIIFSNQGQLYQSYMFYLYFSHFDPGKYLRLGGTKSGGFSQTHDIGKYEFRTLYQNEDLQPATLYVINPKELRAGIKNNSFDNLDGTEGILTVLK